MSFYREQLETWLKDIEVKADLVIDIGGASNPVSKRIKNWDVKEYIVLDLAIETPKTDFVKYDLNEDGIPMINNKYLVEKADVVFCLELYEYVYNTVQATRNLWSMLKKGGIAYITFPFVYPFHEPKQIDFLRYTQRGVEKLLELANFSHWEINARIDRSKILQSFYKADGMHPVKNYNHNVTGFLVKAIK